MDLPVNLGLIYGSARAGRFCDKVVGWAAAEIAATGNFTTDIIDPRIELPILNQEQIGQRTGSTLWQRIAGAEAFIVVTPEYNHGYPAPLKSLIDSVGREWHAKPVAFVSYGGVSGGLRALEQLRQVFAELHSVTVRDSVSFASAWEQFDASGRLLEPERPRRSLHAMLENLRWWAIALRNARRKTPYTAAA